MTYRVFEIRAKDRARYEEAVQDDVLGRQSLTLRDAKQLGYTDRDTFFVLVEGTEQGLYRAETLLLEFARRAAKPEEILKQIKDEEDQAASGLGFILGG